MDCSEVSEIRKKKLKFQFIPHNLAKQLVVLQEEIKLNICLYWLSSNVHSLPVPESFRGNA
jgi:hypothetical protein